MRRPACRTICCLLLSAFCLLWTGCWRRGTSEPIRIGHVTPLSGPDKYIGEHSRQGIDLAVEEANKDPINGRRVAVDHVNSQGDKSLIRAQTQRLAKINQVVALLLGTEASDVEDLDSVAQEYKVPLLVLGGTPDRPGGDYVFHTGVRPAHQGEVLARFAAQDPLKAQRVVILTSVSNSAAAAVSSSLAEAFAKEFRQGGGQVAGEWTYKGSAEFKDLVERIRKSGPQAVVVAGTAGDAVDLLKAGLEKVPVLFGGEEGSLRALQSAQPANPVYLATIFVADNGTPEGKKFAGDYEKRFHEPPDLHAALAYDDARLLFEAMRQAKSFDGSKVRDALAEVKDWASLTGPLSFKDHWAARRLFIVRLQEREMKAVAAYEPDGTPSPSR